MSVYDTVLPLHCIALHRRNLMWHQTIRYAGMAATWRGMNWKRNHKMCSDGLIEIQLRGKKTFSAWKCICTRANERRRNVNNRTRDLQRQSEHEKLIHRKRLNRYVSVCVPRGVCLMSTMACARFIFNTFRCADARSAETSITALWELSYDSREEWVCGRRRRGKVKRGREQSKSKWN